MAWTQTDLDKLNEAIGQGVTTVTYRDRTVSYRSLDEMLRLRTMMAGEIASATSTSTEERVQRVVAPVAIPVALGAPHEHQVMPGHAARQSRGLRKTVVRRDTREHDQQR